jgi:hypothetical protein
MKDILQDIVSHTHALGFLSIVKVTTENNESKIDSMSDDRRVIMQAETKTPIAAMDGVIGMPQLNKLDYLLKCNEYQDNAKIEVVQGTRNNEVVPTGLHFENQAGDFKNDYQFMSSSIINDKLKSVKFRGVKWDVEIEPNVQSIQRMNFQASANTEHTTFLARTDGDKLKFIFGDASTHGGEFIFATGVTGKLDKGWTWPVAQVLSILKLGQSNTCKMHFSNEAAMMITLDSGLATYKYIIPAVTV